MTLYKERHHIHNKYYLTNIGRFKKLINTLNNSKIFKYKTVNIRRLY
jgi:hypothetical protein